MKSSFKKQLIYRGNLILLMVNTAFFIFLFLGNTSVNTEQQVDFSNEFLREELNFTDEQYREITEMDREAQQKYQIVLQLLCQNRYRLLNELAKPYPSVQEMQGIAENVGFLHRALKVQTIEHLMHIKKVCTPEQTGKLNKIFLEILDMDHYCPFCKQKCTREEKNRRYPVFFPYDREAEKKMQEQLNRQESYSE